MDRPDIPNTHVSLLAAFAAGDADAWARFFGRYGPLVRRWCVLRGLRDEDADDLTQELMIELRDKLARYDASRRFRVWLKSVVGNFLADWWRDRAQRIGDEGTGDSDVQRHLESLSAPDSVEEILDTIHHTLSSEGRNVADSVRAKVSEENWQAFYLTVCEGRPGAEVAKTQGRTAGAIYQAAYRVGNMLRAEAGRLFGPT